MPIPNSVTLAQLNEAIKPLCDLLGTSPKNFYANPGMQIGDEIRFTVPIDHDADPSGRAKAYPADRRPEVFPPHPQGQDAEPIVVGEEPYFPEWGYEVRVEVTKQ